MEYNNCIFKLKLRIFGVLTKVSMQQPGMKKGDLKDLMTNTKKYNNKIDNYHLDDKVTETNTYVKLSLFSIVLIISIAQPLTSYVSFPIDFTYDAGTS